MPDPAALVPILVGAALQRRLHDQPATLRGHDA
jgi:hypothetical protein